MVVGGLRFARSFLFILFTAFLVVLGDMPHKRSASQLEKRRIRAFTNGFGRVPGKWLARRSNCSDDEESQIIDAFLAALSGNETSEFLLCAATSDAIPLLASTAAVSGTHPRIPQMYDCGVQTDISTGLCFAALSGYDIEGFSFHHAATQSELSFPASGVVHSGFVAAGSPLSALLERSVFSIEHFKLPCLQHGFERQFFPPCKWCSIAARCTEQRIGCLGGATDGVDSVCATADYETPAFPLSGLALFGAGPGLASHAPDKCDHFHIGTPPDCVVMPASKARLCDGASPLQLYHSSKPDFATHFFEIASEDEDMSPRSGLSSYPNCKMHDAIEIPEFPRFAVEEPDMQEVNSYVRTACYKHAFELHIVRLSILVNVMMELMGSKTVLKRYGFVKASRDCTGYLATTKNSSSGQLASWLVVGVEQFAGAGGRFRLSLHNGVSLFKFLVLNRNQCSQNNLLELLLG